MKPEYLAFTPEMIPAAGNLLAERHRRNRASLSLLPERFEDIRVATNAVEALWNKKFRTGYAAFRSGSMTAYLLGEHTTQPRGLCGYVYLPGYAQTDMMTLREIFNQTTRRKKVVLSWAPHVKPLPLAVPHSFLLAAAMGGCDVTVAHPPNFELAPEVMEQAQQIAAKSGGTVKVSNNHDEAFKGAGVIYAEELVVA